MPLHRVNFAREYREQVFADFLAEYRAAARRIPTCSATARSSSARCAATRSASAPTRSRPATTRASAHGRRRARCCKARDAARIRATSCTPSTRRRSRDVLLPLGELTKSEVRELRARSRPARRRQEGQHRHLLHRRAAVPRIPAPLPAGRPGADRDARRRASSASTAASRTTRSASATGFTSAAARTPPRTPWYVARKGLGAQRARRRAGPRPPAAASAGSLTEPRALDRHAAAVRRAVAALRREDPLSPARSALRGRCARRDARDVQFDEPQRALTPGSSSCSTTATVASAARRSIDASDA